MAWVFIELDFSSDLRDAQCLRFAPNLWVMFQLMLGQQSCWGQPLVDRPPLAEDHPFWAECNTTRPQRRTRPNRPYRLGPEPAYTLWRKGKSKKLNIEYNYFDCNLLAHIVIVVDQTRSSIIAWFLPQNTSLIDQGAKDHRCRNRSQQSNFNPLDAQGKRPLIVMDTPGIKIWNNLKTFFTKPFLVYSLLP